MWWDNDIGTEEQESSTTLPTMQMLQRIHPYVRPHLPVFALAFGLALLGVAMILMQPVIFRKIIDVDFPSGDLRLLMRSSLAYFGLLTGGALATGTATVVLGRSGVEVVNRIKRELFSHIMGLGLPWIEKHPVGTLVARIESDSQRLVNLTSTMAMRILSALVMIGGAMLVIAGTDLRLFAVAGVFLPLMVVGTLILFRQMRSRFRKERKYYAEVSGQVAELVPAGRLIQALGRRSWAEARLAAKNLFYKRFTVRLMFLEYGFWNGLGLIEILMTCAALWLGTYWIEAGSMTTGTLVMFAQYASMIYWPVIELSEQLGEIQRAGGAADRIFGMFATPESVPTPAEARSLPRRAGRLAFEEVHFEYDEGVPVLSDFSLVVEPGETVALVGPTGGGKSTIINLVTRLRDVTRGRITLDGVDIRGFDPREYRSLFGLVLQDLYLFPASVEDNLRAFRDEVALSQVREAAAVAGIEAEILSRPGGFAAVLSERGADLSYGQRQLLALARALAVDPPVMVLDEATSSVDPRTERNIQRTLDRLTRGRTTLVVAHRLSTIRHADRILVIEDGRICEQGHHDELLRRKGVYAELLASQHGGDGELLFVDEQQRAEGDRAVADRQARRPGRQDSDGAPEHRETQQEETLHEPR